MTNPVKIVASDKSRLGSGIGAALILNTDFHYEAKVVQSGSVSGYPNQLRTYGVVTIDTPFGSDTGNAFGFTTFC